MGLWHLCSTAPVGGSAGGNSRQCLPHQGAVAGMHGAGSSELPAEDHLPFPFSLLPPWPGIWPDPTGLLDINAKACGSLDLSPQQPDSVIYVPWVPSEDLFALGGRGGPCA